MTNIKDFDCDITIRKATKNDSAEMASVHIASWKETYRGVIDEDFLDILDIDQRKEEWDRGFKNNHLVAFVSIHQGAIVGFIAGGPPRNFRGDFDSEIYAIYLLKKFQRRRIGYKMYQAFVLNLLADKILVWVLRDNPSKVFYEKVGGSIIDQKNISIGGKTLVELAYSIETRRVVTGARGGS